jgi:uncharacterized protein (DUF4213/DUF364 family)
MAGSVDRGDMNQGKSEEMSVLEDLISTLDTSAEVRDIRLGLFHTGVLTRNCGLAATLPRDALREGSPSPGDPGYLIEKGALPLARLALSHNLLESVIGMATINSLLEIDEQGCVELNAGDIIAEEGAGKKVAIVGHFPFVSRLRESASDLWVIEKNPRDGDFGEAESESLIPQADVVGITGTAFTNHTIEYLLGLCQPKAYVVIIGDTAPLSPVLFDYGIDAVAGTKVINPELALRCVSQGATYREIRGIRRLTMLKNRGKIC